MAKKPAVKTPPKVNTGAIMPQKVSVPGIARGRSESVGRGKTAVNARSGARRYGR